MLEEGERLTGGRFEESLLRRGLWEGFSVNGDWRLELSILLGRRSALCLVGFSGSIGNGRASGEDSSSVGKKSHSSSLILSNISSADIFGGRGSGNLNAHDPLDSMSVVV